MACPAIAPPATPACQQYSLQSVSQLALAIEWALFAAFDVHERGVLSQTNQLSANVTSWHYRLKSSAEGPRMHTGLQAWQGRTQGGLRHGQRNGGQH